MTAWSKDAFIFDAIATGYLIVHENGEIWRRTRFALGEDGVRLGAEVRQVKFQTHKKSGRVFFNMTWRPTPDATETITKSVLVNRVIALAFLPNPLNLPVVNHIDGEKQHNYLRQPTPELFAKWGEYQLEWSTGRDNEKHAHATGLKSGRGSQNANARLTAAQVLEIRAREHSDAPEVLALAYGVSKTTINSVLKRRTWIHLP